MYVCLIIGTVFVGRFGFPDEISDLQTNGVFMNLILRIRLPRILASLIVGAGLAVSGLVMQNIFQNPLADPGVLGISQAAGFGASLGFLLFPRFNIPVHIFAFLSGMAALFLVLQLAKSIKSDNRIALVFAGISISALFSAGLGIIKYLADPLDQLPSIVFWLLGSLSATSWPTVLQLVPISVISILLLYFLRWRINVYGLNEPVLFSMGVKKNREISLILGLAVLLTTTIISFAGLVGWVGLIIPNISRIIFGSDTRRSLPASIFLGSAFVLVCDTFARSMIPGEIPLGIITALLGAGAFIYLFKTKNNLV